MDDELLMIPGPTILPPEVREALARPSLYHRGDAFAAILSECESGLQALLGTTQPVALLTSSGTGAVEAMVVSTLSPGDRVLAVNSGKFGERMGKIAQAYGAEVTFLEVPPGAAANADQVAAALETGGQRALLFVYNETSTGVKQPAAELARVAAQHGALVLVDAVSAVGGLPFRMDEWGIGGVGAGSQKALMLPPGLACASLSEAAQEMSRTARMPRFYFDLLKAFAAQAKGQTPYTPGVNLILALQASLRLIMAEGLEAFQQRHCRLARACRRAAETAGLDLLVTDTAAASDVVTAINSPGGLDSGLLVKAVRNRHNIVISGGQDQLKGRIFRIGHLGAARLEDLLRTWEAVATELTALGHACSVADCLSATREAYEAGV